MKGTLTSLTAAVLLMGGSTIAMAQVEDETYGAQPGQEMQDDALPTEPEAAPGPEAGLDADAGADIQAGAEAEADDDAGAQAEWDADAGADADTQY